MEKKKEKKQATLDIEGYVSTLETQLEKGFKGKITEIVPITNKDFFKDASGSFDVKDGFSVTVLVESENQEFSNWFSKPNARGYEKSNLFAFKSKYGSVPKINMIVDVYIDDNGFFRIKF